jgi:hypothetical protein
MPVRDDAWAIFMGILDSRLAELELTATWLAKTIGEDPAKVRSWRHPSRDGSLRHPTLAQLPAVARALRLGGDDDEEYDPLFLPRQMGILPDAVSTEVFDAEFRLQKLKLKIMDAQASAAELGRHNGALEIAKAAMSSGKWAVSIWPALEGPRDHLMHVADRVTIIRTNPTLRGELRWQELWADPKMKFAIRSAEAVQSGRLERFLPRQEHSASHWSISHIGSPSSPIVTKPHLGLGSVGFASLTSLSGVNDVASIVAKVIGYGLSTTRSLAAATTGMGQPVHALIHRQTAHSNFISRPPKKRCWSHHGIVPKGWTHPFDSDGEESDTAFVWLSESDSLLRRAAAEQPDHIESEEILTAERNRMITGLREFQSALVLEVHDQSSTAARWGRTLRLVKEIVDKFYEQKLVPDNLSEIHSSVRSRDETTFGPAFDWLRKNGCKAFEY